MLNFVSTKEKKQQLKTGGNSNTAKDYENYKQFPDNR